MNTISLCAVRTNHAMFNLIQCKNNTNYFYYKDEKPWELGTFCPTSDSPNLCRAVYLFKYNYIRRQQGM